MNSIIELTNYFCVYLKYSLKSITKLIKLINATVILIYFANFFLTAFNWKLLKLRDVEKF